MIFFTKAIQLGLIALTISTSNTVIASEKLHPWGEMALMDLTVIQQTIKDHHVGPVDPENPGYKVWLNDGYQAAVEMTKSVVSFNDYVATISHYTDGFDDGHITFYSDIDPTRLAWPKFTLKRLSGKTLVSDTQSNALKDLQQGDQLISCDGKSVEQLMAERVYPYQGISDETTLNFATIDTLAPLLLSGVLDESGDIVLTFNEAMAAAMPIISTNKVGAVDEYIKHKENGFFCDISVESINEGIKYYLDNKGLINEHANKNRIIMKESLGDVKNEVKFLLKELKN